MATPTSEEARDKRDQHIGATLARVLRLRRHAGNRTHWDTLWGSKTEIGLARTVRRIVSEEIPLPLRTHTNFRIRFPGQTCWSRVEVEVADKSTKIAAFKDAGFEVDDIETHDDQ